MEILTEKKLEAIILNQLEKSCRDQGWSINKFGVIRNQKHECPIVAALKPFTHNHPDLYTNRLWAFKAVNDAFGYENAINCHPLIKVMQIAADTYLKNLGKTTQDYRRKIINALGLKN